jgi:methanogenic corrinoid protein MtbC1
MYGEADLALIRKMRALIDSGMSAGDAARSAHAELDAESPQPAAGFESVIERLYGLVSGMEADALARASRAALALGDAHTVVHGVYVPVLRMVGDAWHDGTLTVAHEHLASEIIGGIVRDMLRHVQPAYPRARAVLGCFAEELHTLPLYIAGFTFARAGVTTQLLGARTDPDALRAAIRHLMPHIVGISITATPDPEKVGPWLDGYAEAAGALPWLVGGSGASAVASEVEARGGIVARGSADDLRAAIERALARVGANRGG